MRTRQAPLFLSRATAGVNPSAALSGPALAVLLAGPALSLPGMRVISKVMGLKKTVAFCGWVVIMAAVSGFDVRDHLWTEP